MTESTILNPPSGWLKIFFKIPVFITRMGFAGWERLIGVDWMRASTVGSKSGKKRYSMVDVLIHDKGSDTDSIEVGFGKRSDWYRNIQTSPSFEAQVGRRKFHAIAEKLPTVRIEDIMVDFIHHRPIYAKSVLNMVNFTFTTEEELRRMASQWMLLAVHPK